MYSHITVVNLGDIDCCTVYWASEQVAFTVEYYLADAFMRSKVAQCGENAVQWSIKTEQKLGDIFYSGFIATEGYTDMFGSCRRRGRTSG